MFKNELLLKISSNMNFTMSTKPAISQEHALKLSQAGAKAFFNITASWKLKNEEEMILLGTPGRTNFYKWKRIQRQPISLKTL